VLAKITPNYWYWDYTPPYYSKTNYPAVEIFNQSCYRNLDYVAKQDGTYLSGQHIKARYNMEFALRTMPIRWRYYTGLN